MKKQILFFITLLIGVGLHAQTSSVQFIHNSADISVDTIDIYVNNVKVADDVKFRSSTPFLNITGGNVKIDITNFQTNNNSNPLYSQNITLSGGNYIAVLEGILSLGYSPPRTVVPFNIHLQGGAKTTTTAGNVEIIFHQGSTDLRNMDLLQIPGKTKILQNVPFGSISSYFSKSADDYLFQIRETSSQKIAGEYQAFLASNNLSGKAITLLTSGFNDPLVNNYGKNFGLFASLPSGGPFVQFLAVPPSQARVQFIHNSADASVSTVDVWANNTLLYDNLNYLYCKAFEDFPSDTNIVISITPSNSVDTTNAYLQKTINLSGYKTHIFVLEGIQSNSGYSPGKSTRPFVLQHISTAKEVSLFKNNTDLAFHNGSTDLDIVDFYNNTLPSFLIINNLAYSQTSGYIPFSTQNFDLQMRAKRQGIIVAQYKLPLQNLNLQDSAGLVVTSGFLDPSKNSNGNGLGLYYAPPAGGPMLGFLKARITSTLVQFLHNSPDKSVDTVDVYIGNRKVLNDFTYLHSSPFMAIRADSNLTVSIAPHNSVDSSNSFYSKSINFDTLKSRYLVIEGIKDAGYNPSSSSNPFLVRQHDGAKILAGTEHDIDVLLYNGSTDIGQLDIDEVSNSTQQLASNLAYGNFSGFHSVSNENYLLHVENNGSFSKTYGAPFKNYGLRDKAIMVLASGFMDPAQNKNGNPFGMYIALPSGGKFIKLQETLVGLNEQNNTEVAISVFPNPSKGEFYIKSSITEQEAMTLQVHDSNGRLIYMEQFNANVGEQSKKVSLTNVENGYYLISIKDRNGLLQSGVIQIVK